MQVKLRTKSLLDGRESYYLDIYIKGKRNYEFLNLYLLKAKNLADKDLNKETKIQAEHLRAKKQLEIQGSIHGYVPTSKARVDFVDYFNSLCEKRKITGVDHASWISTLKHLKAFVGNKSVSIGEIDEAWLENFKEYLMYEAKKTNDVKITQNSAHHYFNRVKNSFKGAYRNKIIKDNPADRVDYIKQTETKREFLTFEELQTLAKTECRYPLLKKAFIFSTLTGLRWSDIQKLVWSEVHYSEKTGWAIYFRQKKTDGIEYLPISEQARNILDADRGEPDERVFKGLKYSSYVNAALVKWCAAAKITKNITFHCARHTNATLLLVNGADIYIVSKLLGHSDIKTTEIYAHLVNQRKVEAVNKIPLLEL